VLLWDHPDRLLPPAVWLHRPRRRAGV